MTQSLSPNDSVVDAIAAPAAPAATPAAEAVKKPGLFDPTLDEPRRGGIEWRNLDWPVVIAIGGLHLACILAFFPQLFSWSALAIMAVMIVVTSPIGITLCYHRLLTHGSFKTPRWFKYVLTVCGCLAWQGGPVTWVGVHRLHHKHSDHDHDPHSPTHGFTWSHIFWTLHKKVEGIWGPDAAKDLLRDKGMALLDKYFYVPQFVLIAVLFGLGTWISDWTLGLGWVIWGVAVRAVFVYHTTWFVNSASHTWGYQNFSDSGDHSTNNWWVALLSFGEGWHNNHHAHPRLATHGLRWYEVDPTAWMIRVLEWVGLAKDVKRPDEKVKAVLRGDAEPDKISPTIVSEADEPKTA